MTPDKKAALLLVGQLRKDLFILLLLVVAAKTCATAINTGRDAGPQKDESADHTPPPEAM